jgi:hypothetical protein
LDKLHVTQHLKTWWRQRLSQKNHGQSSL